MAVHRKSRYKTYVATKLGHKLDNNNMNILHSVLYFEEYKGKDEFGYIVHPYLEHGQWFMNGMVYSIEEIGKRCQIPDDDLIVLKLQYGS